MHTPLDGFWLPRKMREKLLLPEAEYVVAASCYGRPCLPEDPGAVSVRWPKLSLVQWNYLLAALQENRRQAPVGEQLWLRLQNALRETSRQFSLPSHPWRLQALSALPDYTGYSEPMISFTLQALELFAPEQFPKSLSTTPTTSAALTWQKMGDLPGRIRFFPASSWQRWLNRVFRNQPLFTTPALPDLVVGFGAGNVPGTALLIAILAWSAALTGNALPAVVIKNSRHEPIFSPIVLRALEAVDPELVSTTAVLVWDYEEEPVQDLLFSRADLVFAAASDETIAQVQSQIAQARQSKSVKNSRPIRFHGHGHKVSFSAISKEVLARDLVDLSSGQPLLDIVALLAGLDSVFWDQHGCLSSRVHFLETGEPGCHTAEEYANRLEAQLRLLAGFLPRGAWPRQQLHDRFDRYKQMEVAGHVKVFSQYDDGFLIVLDQRSLNAATFASLVNDCQGRVIAVRPVRNLMEIPEALRLLPATNLQSMSVAVGRAGEGLTEQFLRFAEACGRRGVTALRTVGRGAFPQLAYSWDGLLPLDVVKERPAGYFTTIEFDAPYEQMLETFHLLLRRGARISP